MNTQKRYGSLLPIYLFFNISFYLYVCYVNCVKRTHFILLYLWRLTYHRSHRDRCWGWWCSSPGSARQSHRCSTAHHCCSSPHRAPDLWERKSIASLKNNLVRGLIKNKNTWLLKCLSIFQFCTMCKNTTQALFIFLPLPNPRLVNYGLWAKSSQRS